MSRLSNKPPRHERLQFLIEKRAQGWTYQRIADELGVSEKTLKRDRADSNFQDFIDELIREQLLTINLPELSLKDQLKYRDRLLEKLMPRKIEQKGGSQIHVTYEWGTDKDSASRDA